MLFFILLFATVLGKVPITLRVVKDYAHPEGTVSEWITIPLDPGFLNGATTATLKEVVWCKSIALSTSRGDLNECQAPGLMHLRLFPSTTPLPLVRILEDEPHVIYIDPANIGGWDQTHMFEIVVKASASESARYGAATDLIQIVRFNAPPGKMAADEIVPISSSSSSSSSASTFSSSSTLSPFVKETEQQYQWPAALVVFLVGLVGLSIVGMLQFTSLGARLKNRVGVLQRQYRVGGGKGVYNFMGSSPLDVEMADFKSSSSVLEEMDEEDALELLKSLGKGASPAFDANR
jgi:hypothetical protein